MAAPLRIDVPPRMDRTTFRAWSDATPGRWERVDGQPVRMQSERWRHNRLKGRVFRVLEDAVAEAGLPCHVAADGMAVEIDDDTDYEPDALVFCGDPLALDAVAVPAPVIVVEITSRSTASYDKLDKLDGYFRVASVMHYLIVSATRRLVLHNARVGGDIVPRIVTGGRIVCDPPGLGFALEEIYAVLP